MSQRISSFQIGTIFYQSGYGYPTHVATKGCTYIDIDTAIEYINRDGLADWVPFLDGSTVITGGTTTGAYLPLSGGTVYGPTSFTSGLTATTISATTYQNLPITVTGGTYSSGTTFLNNSTGGTISLTGYTYIPHLEYDNSNSTFWNNGFGNVSSNISFGQNALVSNTSGTFNTAFGSESLSATTSGNFNTGIGAGSLTNNLNGVQNFAIGSYALYANTSGNYNTAIGTAALQDNTVAERNVAIGGFSLYRNTGNRNIAIGFFAGVATKGSDNILLGANAINITDGLVSGSNNTIIGTLLSGVINGSNNTIFGKPTGLSSATTNNIIIADGSGNIRFRDNNINTILPRLTGSGDRMVIASPNGELSARTITDTTFTGGTVSGPTIFTSGITANTISNVDYINFKTLPTVPNPTGGTLYFDSNENALSYKPLTNQNDVTVNLGQESLIKIYNNLGYQINNGQVLHITGSTTTGGTPTVALANASKLATTTTQGLAQTSGVATHDIPNGQYGFMTNFGVVRDINTSAFTAGDEIYLSDTVDGALTNNPDNIALTSRVSTVGFCLESSPTIGKILVVISNENKVESLTQKEVNVLLGNTISTGVYQYTGMTQGTGQTINVAMMRGWLVQNTYSYAIAPKVTSIYYTGGTNIPLTYLSSADATYILVSSGSTLYQQTTFPTPQQRRENIFLGKVVHPNRSTITSINQTVDFDVSPMSAIRDLWTPLKLINQGVVVSPHSTTLEINTSAGTLWGNGIGWTTNQLNPDSISISGTSPTTFQYRSRLGPITGGTAPYTGNTTFIDPSHYDNNGVISNVGGGSNSSTNQRVYLFPTGLIRIQYGQQVYGSLAAAVAGSQTEQFVEYANNRDNGVLIGIISVNKNTTNLSNATYATFNFVSKFGEIMGGTGGLSTTTLQQAYDNSSTPEIVTNSTLGALSIKNGTGNADNVTRLLEGLNAAGNTTSFIRADGAISGTSVSSTTYNGGSYTTTGTYGSATINASNNQSMIVISGSGTVGGANYVDFIQITNTAVGVTNPNKTIRLNNTGGIEFLNSVYTASTLTLGDGGALFVGGGNAASVTSNDASTNYLSFNLNSTQIYDDGNTHIHARGNGNSMWINTNNAGIIIGGQSPVAGGGAASGIIMGSGSTTIKAFANIYGSKTYTIGSYGYLATIGAGTGAGTTAPYSLYCNNRIEATEFDATSDERLKVIHGEIELNDAIKLINNLKPIKYTWKNSEDKGVKTGYSAQQVEKAGFKHLIGHIPNEDLEATTDDEGFTSPLGFQLTMNYDQVTPYHGVVIKHLLEEIEILKSEIAKLKNNKN